MESLDVNRSLAFQLACLHENILETYDLRQDLLFELDLYGRIARTNAVKEILDEAASYIEHARSTFSNRIGASADRTSVLYAGLLKIAEFDGELKKRLTDQNLGITKVHEELAEAFLLQFKILRVYSNA